jgi:hypothetical protein
MAVKIEQIDDLEHLSMKLEEYSESMKTAATEAEVTFTNKLEGSENEAVVAFVEVMNDLKSNAFAHLPEATDTFSTALQTYHSALKGAGFDNLIKSVKPIVEEDYCQEVTTTEYNKAEEAGTALEKVINQVAEKLPEVSTSSISGKHLTTLKNELTSKTNEIKSTRSTVQTAQTTFKSGLKTVIDQLKQCSQAIENTMNITDPKAGVKPANMVQLIRDGYGEVVVTLVNSEKMSADDMKALNYLAKDNYKDFFAMNPDKLNDAVFQVVVSKVVDMVDLPKKGETPKNHTKLQAFLNSLLLQSEGRIEKFASRIGAMNDYMLTQYNAIMSVSKAEWLSGYTSDLDLTDKELAEMRSKLDKDWGKMEQLANKLSALSGLWEAVYVMDTPTTVGKPQEYGNGKQGQTLYQERNFSIKDLTLSCGKTFSFQLVESGYTYSMKDVKVPYTLEKTVNSSIHEDALSQADANAKKRIYEYRQEKVKAIGKALGEGLTLAIGTVSKGATALISIAQAMAESKGFKAANETVKSSDKWIKGSKLPDKAKALVGKVSSVSNTILSGLSTLTETEAKLRSLDKKIADEQVQLLYNLLNAGGKEVQIQNIYTGKTETVLAVSGVPSVEVANRINELCTNGFKGYIKANGKEKEFNDTKMEESTQKTKSGKQDTQSIELKERKLTKEEEFIYYGSNGPNKVKMEDLDYEELDNKLQNIMTKIGLSEDQAKAWVRNYGT